MAKKNQVGTRGKIVRLFSGRTTVMQKEPDLFLYEANKNAVVPYDFKVPAYSFFGKIEQYLRNHETVVPVVDCVTWQQLLEYNPELIVMHKNIVAYEGREFPDQAWNLLAQRLVLFLKNNHTLLITNEIIVEKTVTA